MTAGDRTRTWKDFQDAVNMTAAQISEWLDTDASKSVGQRPSGEGESTGHHSGRRIVSILKSKKAPGESGARTNPQRRFARPIHHAYSGE